MIIWMSTDSESYGAFVYGLTLNCHASTSCIYSTYIFRLKERGAQSIREGATT